MSRECTLYLLSIWSDNTNLLVVPTKWYATSALSNWLWLQLVNSKISLKCGVKSHGHHATLIHIYARANDVWGCEIAANWWHRKKVKPLPFIRDYYYAFCLFCVKYSVFLHYSSSLAIQLVYLIDEHHVLTVSCCWLIVATANWIVQMLHIILWE